MNLIERIDKLSYDDLKEFTKLLIGVTCSNLEGLVFAGADRDSKEMLDRFLINKGIIELNTDYDIDSALLISHMTSPEMLTFFINKGLNTYMKLRQGTTLVHMATSFGSLDAVKIFLDCEICPLESNHNRESAFTVAAKYNRVPILKEIVDYELSRP